MWDVVKLIGLWAFLVFAIALAVGLSVSHALSWVSEHYIHRSECLAVREASRLRCADCGGAFVRPPTAVEPSEGEMT